MNAARTGVLTEAGDLDRPAMAERVFADEQARRHLEGIVHPLVYEQIHRWLVERPEGPRPDAPG